MLLVLRDLGEGCADLVLQLNQLRGDYALDDSVAVLHHLGAVVEELEVEQTALLKVVVQLFLAVVALPEPA